MSALDVALTAVLGFHVFVGAPGGVCGKRLLHGCKNYARCQAFVKGKIVFLYYFVQPDNTGTSIFFFFIVSWHLQLDPYGFTSPRSSYPAAALWNMDGSNKFARKRPQARYLSIKELCFKRKFRPKPEDLSIAQRTNASGYFREPSEPLIRQRFDRRLTDSRIGDKKCCPAAIGTEEGTHMRCYFSIILVLGALAHAQVLSDRWSEAKANEWYQHQPWLVGSNFLPATAINELEMWQADTFDPQEIDKELGWAENLGMNTMRVFLHDLLWQQDSAGFQKRIDSFLRIAAKHHIRPIFVLFDSCWDPYPKLGPQHPPVPGVHNSGWVQSPGAKALADPGQEARLRAYVEGVVGAFANDSRILAWDVWNEPSNSNGGAYGNVELKDKGQRVLELLPKVFAWARSIHPSQPLTSGLWEGDWSAPEKLDPIARVQFEQSDVLSFHNYNWPEDFEDHVRWLEAYHRPILCTEYMARSVGSTFDTVLPIAKRHHVAAINWGLVAGKSQTYLPWDSWEKPYVLQPPPVWFHEVFHPDGKPYREREAEIIRELTGPGAH